MGLRIQPPGVSPSIGRTQESLLRNLSRLSSARRIVQPGDDAAGLAISESLRAQERSQLQGIRNLQDGSSVAQTAEGGLREISNSLVRLRELSVQAQNGILGDTERAAIQAEFDQLSEEITRIADSTQFNGRNLLNGELSGAGALTVRDGTGEPDDVQQLSVQDQSAAALGVEGLDAADPNTLAAIDNALSQVSSTRGDIGAFESRLRSGIRNLESIRENTAAANSRIADADFAVTTAELARDQLLQQTQAAVQAQANVSTQAALLLLGR